MGPTSAIVLYAVIWWLCFLVALPVRVTTQCDAGEVEPGTHAGAPKVHHLKRKAAIVTVVAAVIWAIVATTIWSGLISLEDLSFFDRALPPL